MTTFVVGDKGKIRHRSSSGVWSDHSPGGLGTYDKFWGIWGVSEIEVYAIGENTSTGTPLWYRWNGSLWDVWSNPPTIDSGYTPIHIFGLSSDLIWITADKFNSPPSRIYQWDGDSWSTIYVTDRHRYGIFAPDSDNIYACGARGYNPPSLYKYVSGTTWTSDTSITEDPIYSICGSNEVLFCQENDNYIWRGTFNSMVRDYIGSITFKYDVDGHGVSGSWSASGKCWVPNVSYGLDQQCRVAIYDGSSWSIVVLSSSNYGQGRAITGTSENDVIIIAGNGSSICNAFVWDGNTWTQESVGSSDFYPMDAWKVPDDDPPELVDQNPAPNSRISVSDSLIAFSVVDASEIETSTIDAYVNEVVAFTSETFLSPFDGPSASFSTTTFGELDGYRVILDYTGDDWDSYQLITVRVVAKDISLNLMDTTYSFRAYDTVSVEFTNIIPTPSSIRVDKDTIIQVDIFDRGSGVDSTSIDAYVEGIHAYIGNTGSFVYPYNGSLSALTPVVVTIDGYSFDGYRITIDKQGLFRSGNQINVIVDGLDKEGN